MQSNFAVLNVTGNKSYIAMIALFFPSLGRIIVRFFHSYASCSRASFPFSQDPTRAKRIRESRAITRRIGSGLVEEKKRAAEGTKDAVQGRDILSALVRANMALRPNQRLSDDEVLSRKHMLPGLVV
jgi:hypothetical protein